MTKEQLKIEIYHISLEKELLLVSPIWLLDLSTTVRWKLIAGGSGVTPIDSLNTHN